MAEALTSGKGTRENPITVANDPLQAFVDLEGDPEAEIEAREREREAAEQVKAQGESHPEPAPEVTPEPETVGDDTPEETPDEPEPEPDEQQAAPEPPENARKRPWERVKELNKELKAEKRARQAQEAKLAELEAWRRQIEDAQRAHYIQQGQVAAEQQRQAEQAKVPTYEEDPLGHLAYRTQFAEQAVQHLAQQNAVNQLFTRVEADELGYVRTNPDYYQARNFLVERTALRNKAMGMSDQENANALEISRQTVIALAVRQGRSVADLVYQMAKAEGWTGAPANGNGAHPEPMPTQDVDPQTRVRQAAAREKQAQASVGSLPSTPGKTGGKRLTRELVMAMTQEEMDQLDREQPGWDDRIER